MNDLRKYVMQQKQFNRKIGEKHDEMAGHMVRMDTDILVKRVEEKGKKT